jgi:DNA-binding MarR family transcriptional regulator
MNTIRMELLDIVQQHIKKILPVPEAVRINIVFRIFTEDPTKGDICSAAGVSREAAESVLEKYVHYNIVTIHHDSETERYKYVGLTDDIKRLWRANPVREKSLERALQAGEDYLKKVEDSGLGEEDAEEVQLLRHALSQTGEEFLGKGD